MAEMQSMRQGEKADTTLFACVAQRGVISYGGLNP
jgi:hypothetical protein